MMVVVAWYASEAYTISFRSPEGFGALKVRKFTHSSRSLLLMKLIGAIVLSGQRRFPANSRQQRPASFDSDHQTICFNTEWERSHQDTSALTDFEDLVRDDFALCRDSCQRNPWRMDRSLAIVK